MLKMYGIISCEGAAYISPGYRHGQDKRN